MPVFLFSQLRLQVLAHVRWRVYISTNETNNAQEGKTMASAFWKEKEEMSACVESARRKMRFSRAADRVGHNLTAERARQIAEANMQRARKLKDFIEARRPTRK